MKHKNVNISFDIALILLVAVMLIGVLRAVPEKFTCDAYLFFAGDVDAVNAYRGEYMSAYSWASITEGLMFEKHNS